MNKFDMFSIPLFETEYTGDIQPIKDGIKSMKKDEGEKISNKGGYHSQTNLHEYNFMKPLMAWIAQQSGFAYEALNIEKQYTDIESCWFNINKTLNSYNNVHMHKGILSGIFYVNAPEGSGKTHFHNFGFNELWEGVGMDVSANQYNSSEYIITPETGRLYLFPSYVYHSVGTNDKEVERISISFNLR